MTYHNSLQNRGDNNQRVNIQNHTISLVTGSLKRVTVLSCKKREDDNQ